MLETGVRRPSTTALLLPLLLLAGCGRCGRPAAGPPERWVPASASGAFLVPRLSEAARQAAELHAAVAALPGQEEAGQLRRVVAAQLGFDPLDPASMAEAGLDPERGLAAAALAAPGAEEDQPLLVLPAADEGKVLALVGRLARERLGATAQGQESAGGRPVQVWRRAPGEPALISLAMAEGYALVSAGSGGPAAVQAALALDRERSLERSPTWQRARAALGEGGALLLLVPAPPPEAAPGFRSEAVSVSLSASARSLRLVGAALLGAEEARLRPLAGPGPGRAGPSPLAPATVLALRASASPAAAWALAAPELRDERLAEPLGRLLEALEPPIDVGFALSPTADLAAALGGRAAGEPLSLVTVEAVAGVKPGAAPGPALAALAAAAGGRGKDGRWTVPAGRAEIAVAISGGRLLLAAGPAGALDALARRGAGEGWKPPTPAAAEALAGGLGGAVLDGASLGKALAALPPEAYGSGPDAVVARSLVERYALGAGGATLSARLDLPAGAVRLALELELAAPPGKAP